MTIKVNDLSWEERNGLIGMKLNYKNDNFKVNINYSKYFLKIMFI